ncbi:MAG: hypothetical protein HYW24_02770 [Candidatus Aenigmarchaeota archaeon]|nr:hypothetical protein [Candidatus Aenigmarchaeota archaeon]
MLKEDIDKELERLKMKKVELVNRINITNFFDEKEEYAEELELIQKQINILEKMK